MGLYHFEVSGDREKEAAAELNNRYCFLVHSHLSGLAFQVEESDLVKRIAEKYNVQVKVSI